MPRIMPEPRYFSIPSAVVGAVVLRNEARKLDAVRAIVDPGPARLNKLAGRDHRRVADYGDEIALAPGSDPQHAEAVLRVVNGGVGWFSLARLGSGCDPTAPGLALSSIVRQRRLQITASTKMHPAAAAQQLQDAGANVVVDVDEVRTVEIHLRR